MSKHGRGRVGLTMIELLVATAILGILLVAVVSLSGSFLGFSTRVGMVNENLEDLNDALGYVGLHVRESISSYGSSSAPLELSGLPKLDGTGSRDDVPCAADDALEPCVAFVVPLTSRTSLENQGYDLVAYHLVPAAAWADRPAGLNVAAGTHVLLEHRKTLCSGTSCPIPGTLTDEDSLSTSLLIDNVIVDGSYVPFAFDIGDRELTVALRLTGTGRLDGVLVPSNGPVSVSVVSRR